MKISTTFNKKKTSTLKELKALLDEYGVYEEYEDEVLNLISMAESVLLPRTQVSHNGIIVYKDKKEGWKIAMDI